MPICIPHIVYRLRGVNPIFRAATSTNFASFRQRKRIKSGLLGFSRGNYDVVQIVQKYYSIARAVVEGPLLGMSNFLKVKNYNFHKNT